MGHTCHSALTEPEIAVTLSQDRPTDRGAGETPQPPESHCVGFVVTLSEEDGARGVGARYWLYNQFFGYYRQIE